ncbi:hypothetical protein [Azospirillum sp. ST 5-10]|uniref:hypothetical protein n=1 Tax=unclassified Azospirillum TaxID=2630922 RepID=UPI003F4A1A8B
MSGDVEHSARLKRDTSRRGMDAEAGMRCVRHSLANLTAGIVASVSSIVAFVGATESFRPDDSRAAALTIGAGLVVCAWSAFRASRCDAEAARELTGRALKDLP